MIAATVAAATILSGCGGGDSAPPAPAGPDLSAPPSGLRWEPYQGVALPRAEQGPAKIDSGAATGFTRTPQGAALAALTHTIRMSLAPDDQWPQVLRAEVAPGAGRDEWTINRAQLSITAPPTPELAPRLLGYQISDYSEQRAAVTIFTEYSDASRAANKTKVVWLFEDWRLELPDPTATTNPVEVIHDLPPDHVKLEAPR